MKNCASRWLFTRIIPGRTVNKTKKTGNMNKLKHMFKGQAVSHITHFSNKRKKFFKLRIAKKFYLATGTYVLLLGLKTVQD
jgi:hypothetical protein